MEWYIFFTLNVRIEYWLRARVTTYINDREISQNKDDEKEEVSNELARKVKEKLREIYI